MTSPRSPPATAAVLHGDKPPRGHDRNATATDAGVPWDADNARNRPGTPAAAAPHGTAARVASIGLFIVSAALVAFAHPAAAVRTETTIEPGEIRLADDRPVAFTTRFFAETRCEAVAREPIEFRLGVHVGQQGHPVLLYARGDDEFRPFADRISLDWTRKPVLPPAYVAQGEVRLEVRANATFLPALETLQYWTTTWALPAPGECPLDPWEQRGEPAETLRILKAAWGQAPEIHEPVVGHDVPWPGGAALLWGVLALAARGRRRRR